MTQCIRMYDAALGHADVCVSEVYADTNGTYNFTEVLWVKDLYYGNINADVAWCEQVQDYLQNEGYVVQHVSAQCAVLYKGWMKDNVVTA